MPPMFTRDDLEAAARLVHGQMAPTPLYAWPTLAARSGAEVWVKHENHGPDRGLQGAWRHHLHRLAAPHPPRQSRRDHRHARQPWPEPGPRRAGGRVCARSSTCRMATRSRRTRQCAPSGRNWSNLAPISTLPAKRRCAVAASTGLFPVPPFHRELVRGVATYAWEMFTARPDLDTVYVPIGCGSGICGVIAARDALGLTTKVVAVVSEGAPTARLSAEAGALVPTDSARTFADGMAVRVPVAEALAIYGPGTDRFVTVTDAEVAEAIRIYYTDTHNLAEGAGAAPLAALMQERDRMRGKKVGVILCGGNIDTGLMRTILGGDTPQI